MGEHVGTDLLHQEIIDSIFILKWYIYIILFP